MNKYSRLFLFLNVFLQTSQTPLILEWFRPLRLCLLPGMEERNYSD